MKFVIAIALACCILALLPATAKADQRVKLIFNLDGGCGNGVVVQQDRLAVTRICQALKPLMKTYDVYLMVNPMLTSKGKTALILDIVASHEIGIVLDVFSSDTHMLGSVTEQNSPYDALHGISISVEELDGLKKRYGSRLAGLRFHEVTAQDFTVYAMKTTDPQWKPANLKLPQDDYFQPALVEPFVKYASEHSMFVQWSDWHWSELAKWDQKQPQRESHLSEILRKYPGVITVTYANNEPKALEEGRLQGWWKSVEKFAKQGSNGYGLSNQSWIANDVTCPIKLITDWTQSALDRGCKIIQFEPVWYFFKLPRGTFYVEEYKQSPDWADRGVARDSFPKLVDALVKNAR